MSLKTEKFITTIDNEFNPFTESDEWLKFDEDSGYCTSGYIDRIATLMFPKKKPSELSSEDYDKVFEEIVAFNPLMYKIVTQEVEFDPLQDQYPFMS